MLNTFQSSVFIVNNCVSGCLSARLLSAVVVNPRYPEVMPLFSLSLLWKGERSGRTDDNLRVRASPLLRCSVWNSFLNDMFVMWSGDGERGERVPLRAAGTTTRSPDPDQSDPALVRVSGCVSGDGESSVWRVWGTQGVSQREDVLAYCQVTHSTCCTCAEERISMIESWKLTMQPCYFSNVGYFRVKLTCKWHNL